MRHVRMPARLFLLFVPLPPHGAETNWNSCSSSPTNTRYSVLVSSGYGLPWPLPVDLYLRSLTNLIYFTSISLTSFALWVCCLALPGFFSWWPLVVGLGDRRMAMLVASRRLSNGLTPSVLVGALPSSYWRSYSTSFREERDTFGPILVPSDKLGSRSLSLSLSIYCVCKN